MPPDGYHRVSVPDEVMEQLALVMAEYDCDSWAETIKAAATIALERDKAELAQILAVGTNSCKPVIRLTGYIKPLSVIYSNID